MCTHGKILLWTVDTSVDTLNSQCFETFSIKKKRKKKTDLQQSIKGHQQYSSDPSLLLNIVSCLSMNRDYAKKFYLAAVSV